MRTLTTLTLGAALSLATSASFAGEALDRVMSNGILKVATNANWAPQSFINDDNKMDGFDVDVAKDIGKRLGVKVEFVTPGWDVITAGHWNGRWDMTVGSVTPTKERSKVLDFPAVYYYTPASVAVHKNSEVARASDLNGKTMGACTACTYELYLQKDLTIDADGVPSFTYDIDAGELKSYETVAGLFDDLRLGDGVRLDGLVEALPAIRKAIENKYPFKIIGDPVFYEPLAVAIDRGDAEFNDKLKTIVTDMRSDGTLSKLSLKWYGIDYTQAK